MSVDGLRAWIGEVERKLGVRTRVFLVLAVIAIGGAGTGIYLAIDTRENAVSEGDVQGLQEEMEAQIGTGATTDATQLEAELRALQAQVAELSDNGGAPAEGNGRGANGSGGGSQGTATPEPDGGSGGLPSE